MGLKERWRSNDCVLRQIKEPGSNPGSIPSPNLHRPPYTYFWDLYTILDKTPGGAETMKNESKRVQPRTNRIDDVRQERDVSEMDNLTEDDVRRIVREEINSCNIEDLHKRVKYLEECGGPGVH